MNIAESNARNCYGSYYQPPETPPVIDRGGELSPLNTPAGVDYLSVRKVKRGCLPTELVVVSRTANTYMTITRDGGMGGPPVIYQVVGEFQRGGFPWRHILPRIRALQLAHQMPVRFSSSLQAEPALQAYDWDTHPDWLNDEIPF